MAGLFFLGVNNGQGYNVLKQMVSSQDYVHDILLVRNLWFNFLLGVYCCCVLRFIQLAMQLK